MGYTHYWSPTPNAKQENVDVAFDICAKILAEKSSILAYEYDQPDTPPECSVSSGTIRFNGIEDHGYETFHYILGGNWAFCKTQYKSYDVVVVACLIILSHFGLAILSSDGNEQDWQDGFDLALRISGISNLEIPKTL